MPRKPAVVPAAATVPPAASSSKAKDSQRPFHVICRACENYEFTISVLGNSATYQGTFTVDGQEVVVVGYDSEKSDGIVCDWSTKVRTKLKTDDGYKWKFRPVSCAKCATDVGRIYTYLPSYPDVEGPKKVALFKNRVSFNYDIDSSSDADVAATLSSSPYKPNSQPGARFLESLQYPPRQNPSGHLKGKHKGNEGDDKEDEEEYEDGEEEDGEDDDDEDEDEEGEEPTPTRKELAKDILSIKKFCLNLDETQDAISQSLELSQNPNKTLQKELSNLKKSFKSFESRLVAVESSVQNRLVALESALQIMLESQSESQPQYSQPTPLDNTQSSIDVSQRRSNISVEIPVKRRHRSLSPKQSKPKYKPFLEPSQSSQNISPPLSEEPADESRKNAKAVAKGKQTTARGTKSQPRQAESTNAPDAQETGEADETEGESRQSKDEGKKVTDTILIISDSESDYDDGTEPTAEHASKRAKLNNKGKKKQEQQTHSYAKKKRGRPSIGSLAKQELRAHRPDEDEDYNDDGGDDGQGFTALARITRSKKSL
ncbi:hypothetical protein TWF481_007379 [Arthrobotrys musiformis]|uniref:Mis18 domain-containing protein n=1 Tax=Arthrobotrys musiformis TaxID=47236 RepID=A0AAV9WD68_9PEZI